MSVLKVDQNNFEQEVLKSDEPVLVDFWASWCGPCKMLSPVVEEISNEAEGFRVASLNIDENPAIAMQYNVTAIPSLIVFSGGNEVNRSVGVVPKDQILALLK
ncbi:MAG: thioredoxin [Anaerovoracaceae bacterium]|jgi:thioredoxin 1